MIPTAKLRPAESRPAVLIVDHSQEARDVLRTLLELRGVDTYEASGAERGLELARERRPGVVVLDLETDPATDDGTLEGFDEQSRRHNTSMVLLGTARRNGGSLPTGQFVSKPYHYGPLIRTIETLLAQSVASV